MPEAQHQPINVGEWIPLGEVQEFDEALGAVQRMIGRPTIRRPQIAPAVKRMQSAMVPLKRAAQSRPFLKPLVNIAQRATDSATTAMNSMAAASAKASIERLNMPTHMISVCFDAVGTLALSGTATVKAPHNNPWRLTSIHTNDSQCTGLRFSSFVLGGTEHIVTSNVTFDANGPSNAGWDAAVFSGKMQALVHPQYRFRPWGLGKGGVLRADSELRMRIYNPLGASASLNVTIFCQSSPCGDNDLYITDKGGVYPTGSKPSKAFFEQLMGGRMTLWPRAA